MQCITQCCNVWHGSVEELTSVYSTNTAAHAFGGFVWSMFCYCVLLGTCAFNIATVNYMLPWVKACYYASELSLSSELIVMKDVDVISVVSSFFLLVLFMFKNLEMVLQYDHRTIWRLCATTFQRKGTIQYCEPYGSNFADLRSWDLTAKIRLLQLRSDNRSRMRSDDVLLSHAARYAMFGAASKAPTVLARRKFTRISFVTLYRQIIHERKLQCATLRVMYHVRGTTNAPSRAL